MKNLYQLAQKNSHWLVLAYAIAACGLTYNRNIFGELSDALLFYFTLPLLMLIALKRKLRDHGLALGNWKEGALWTAVFVGLSLATTWFAVRSLPGIRGYYRFEIFGPALVLNTILYMIAWEFFFRGFMLFGLRKFGCAAANVMQTILFFLMHIGKPPVELYSTLLTGLVFGYITYRSASVIPMVIIHATIFLSVIFFARS
jgi:membrane protease YdiL (CAAX protease family)